MKKLVDDKKLIIKKRKSPQFIAVEGPIGVGKTTLAKRLANTFSCETLLEQPGENPFLERFYQDQKTGALPTQLYFLFQRARKIQEIRQSDMFQKVQVSDFLIEKFLANATGKTLRSRPEAIINMILNIEKLPDVGNLMSLAKGA